MRCLGTQTVTAFGSTSTLKRLTLTRSPPSTSYSTLRSSSTLIFFALVARTSGDLLRLADGGACKRAHPVRDPVGVDDADLEPSVVRSRVLEDLDAAEEASDIADEDAARSA